MRWNLFTKKKKKKPKKTKCVQILQNPKSLDHRIKGNGRTSQAFVNPVPKYARFGRKSIQMINYFTGTPAARINLKQNRYANLVPEYTTASCHQSHNLPPKKQIKRQLKR